MDRGNQCSPRVSCGTPRESSERPVTLTWPRIGRPAPTMCGSGAVSPGASRTAMRAAVISDIHANLPSLEAVLADAEDSGVDERWCLGDVVGYGAHPDGCAELVKERCDAALVGNHDLAVLGELDTSTFSSAAAAAVEWTTSESSRETLDFLAGLEPADESREAAL